ncbi:MAG: hypothetical protein PHE33_11385 [Bacteroidales bacterium]|nr:hypothetical protein [Bacteroidales bacterium]
MKKTFTLLLLSFMASVLSYAQVTAVSVDSEKNYENNTKTAYLTLRGYYGTDLIEGISEQLNSHPDISLFSFYDNTNNKKCMYTASSDFTELMLVDIINDFMSEYYQFDSSNDLPNTEYFEDIKAVKFNISGITDDNHKAQIISELSQLDFVTAVEINHQGICKISIGKTTKGDTIRTAFNNLNLEIIEINIY